MVSEAEYLAELHKYINGREWRENIQSFLRFHCLYFENIEEFHPQQHAIWKSFQDVAESLLQMTLCAMGGSMEELEHALTVVAERPSTGPRDELIKDIILSLQSVEDFHEFALIMHQHCIEQILQAQDENTEYSNRHDMLMRMGFTVETIAEAIERLGELCDVEELISYLSVKAAEIDAKEQSRLAERQFEMNRRRQARQQHDNSSNGSHTRASAQSQPKPSVSKSTSKNQKKQKDSRSNRVNSYEYFEQLQVDNEADNGGFETLPDPMHVAYQKFITEAAQDDVSPIRIHENELAVRFETANSIFETLTTQSNPANDNEQTLELLQWAAEMRLLQHDLLSASESGIHSNDFCFNCAQGLIRWFALLDSQRIALNANRELAAVTGNLLSDNEIKRMADLDEFVAQFGTADEQRLHQLLSRHEKVRKDIYTLYRNISVILSTNYKALSRSVVEETYLYLKEHVHDTSRSIEDFMHSLFADNDQLRAKDDKSLSAVQQMISLSGGLEIINSFLELHGLEDEQHALKHEIDMLLGIPPEQRESRSPLKSMGNASDPNDAHNDLSLGDILSLNKEQLQQFIDSSPPMDMMTPPVGDMASSTSADAACADRADEKLASQSNHEAKQSKDIDAVLQTTPLAESKAEIDKTSADSLEHKSAEMKRDAHTPDVPKVDLLSLLKQSHRNALDALQQTLEAKRLAKLHDLENKLLLRKHKLQQRLGSTGSSAADSTLTVEEEERVIALLESELHELDVNLSNDSQQLTQGLRTKCIQELKSVRELVDNDDSEMRDVDEEALKIRLRKHLSDNNNELESSALKSVKDKYEQERQRLLAHYATERSRQKDRLRRQLEKRLKSGPADDSVLDQFAENLGTLDEKIDKELCKQLTPLRDEMWANLGGVLAANELQLDQSRLRDPSTVTNGLSSIDYAKCESSLTNTTSYLSQLDAMKKMYLEAEEKLQRDLLHKRSQERLRHRRSRATGHDSLLQCLQNEQNETELVNLDERQAIEMIDQVLFDAFDRQLGDWKQDRSSALAMTATESLHNDLDDDMYRLPSKRERSGVKEMESRMRAELLEAFEKAKQDLHDVQLGQREAAKNRLQQRKGRGRSASGNGESKDISESEVDSAIESQVALLEGMFEEVLDGMLHHQPSASASAATTNSLTVSAKTANTATRNEFKINNNDDEYLDSAKNKIVSDHQLKEKKLVDELYADMMSKKKKLEDRIRKKKESDRNNRSAGSGSSSVSMSIIVDEENRQQIESLEKAFESVKASLKHLGASLIGNMTADQLIHMMENMAMQQTAEAQAQSKTVEVGSDPFAYDAKQSEQKTEVEHTVSSQRRGSHSQEHETTAHEQASQQREVNAREAARISTAYQEEQQKHDLMMKIQQTRQRQLLQKKLWERNLNRQQQQQQQQQVQMQLAKSKPALSHNLRAFSGDEVDDHSDAIENTDGNDEDGSEDDNDEPDNHIEIGRYKSQVPQMPSFRQPVARGLVNMPVVLSPGKGNMKPQLGMQSRGLNLAPMMSFRR